MGVAGLAASGGAILDDFDNDGNLDLVASSWQVRDQIHYFHNDGNGSLDERTEAAGLTGEFGGLNIVQTDYNNDGWVDIHVIRGAWLRDAGHAPDSLLKNNGDGTFDDVTEAAGLLSFHPSQAAMWCDFDADGWLDLFVGNETTRGDEHACELFHNNGDGTFTDVAPCSTWKPASMSRASRGAITTTTAGRTFTCRASASPTFS